MGRLSDRTSNIAITTRSPDRTVTLRSTGTTDITVDLAPGSLRGHSEESLARQVNATMRVALVAYQQASRTLLDAELAALESG